MNNRDLTVDESLLVKIIRSPDMALSLQPAEWDVLIRQAKAANLLSYLYTVFLDAGMEGDLPERPGHHLRGSYLVTKRNRFAVCWELSQLQEALYTLAIPIVVLKGAAYVLADLPISRGRLFHDIDILVPHSALKEVEKRLKEWGWRTTHNSAYDQRYYRTWMHEIPPLKHIKRQTVLDVHHSILPLTAKLHPDPRKLLERAVNNGNESDLFWLCDVDMIIHSATHLFHDGELENGLRDLIDIECLIRHFSDREDFWSDLITRAVELDLLLPLQYALRYAEMLLGSRIPDSAKTILAGYGAGKVKRDWIMDPLFRRGLQPDHASCQLFAVGAARWALYVRSHYLRMPLRLLLPHLVRKAFISGDESGLPREVQRFIANNPKN